MKRLLREPLFHFLLIGAALFGVHALRNGDTQDHAGARQLRLSTDEVRWLQETWARQWQRQPSESELRGLVMDYLKESLLAREAAELGLDQNDTVIRRRLAQKIEFLVQDTTRLSEPAEEMLRSFFGARQSEYQTPARVSLTQLFFETEAAARQGLPELATRRADELGERSLLERDQISVDEPALASQFGPQFAAAVFDLTPGDWHGPVASTYGYHLVRVSEREPARPRPLQEVREQVIADWQQEEQIRARDKFFAALLEKYDVVMDDSVKPLLGAWTDLKEGVR
jgi:hypothetical protein